MNFKTASLLAALAAVFLPVPEASAVIFQQHQIFTSAVARILDPANSSTRSEGAVPFSSITQSDAGTSITVTASASPTISADTLMFSLANSVNTDAVSSRWSSQATLEYRFTLTEQTDFLLEYDYNFTYYNSSASDYFQYYILNIDTLTTVAGNMLSTQTEGSTSGTLAAGNYAIYGHLRQGYPPAGPLVGSQDATLTFSVVPEPSALIMALAGTCSLVLRKHRRRETPR